MWLLSKPVRQAYSLVKASVDYRLIGAVLVLAIGASLPCQGSAPSHAARPVERPGRGVSPTPTAFVATSHHNTDWTPVVRDNARLRMVYVPAGCFMMGSAAGDKDELPVHRVCLPAFWIGQTEVTNTQYAACVEADVCRPPYDVTAYEDPARGDHPVVSVTWEQAHAYAAWRGCSLPTEAQWEYAARGPESWTYPWGEVFDGTRLNFCDVNCAYQWRARSHDDEFTGTAPAGSFPGGASWVGALDMSGNVWEWVSTIYRDYPYVAADGREDDSDRRAPRVVRGGSYASSRGYTRAASRDWDSPHLRFVVVGFRVVCPLPAP